MRSDLLPRLAAALLLAALTSSALADDGWKIKKDSDGIRIESRAVPGWSIHEIRSSARVDAPLAAVVAVIDDVPGIPQLSPVVSEAKLTQRQSATRYRVYVAMKMPWPVSDRDLVNQRDIRQDPVTGVVTISDIAIPDAAPREDYVRIVRSQQQWTLTPINAGQTQVQMQMLSDPGGMPAALINALSISTPFDMLTNLRTLAALPEYAHAAPAFLAKTPAPEHP